MANPIIASVYANKEHNVDTSIVTGSFTNSSRTVLFAKPYGFNLPFKPVGVVQGWSPGSMAEAARQL